MPARRRHGRPRAPSEVAPWQTLETTESSDDGADMVNEGSGSHASGVPRGRPRALARKLVARLRVPPPSGRRTRSRQSRAEVARGRQGHPAGRLPARWTTLPFRGARHAFALRTTQPWRAVTGGPAAPSSARRASSSTTRSPSSSRRTRRARALCSSSPSATLLARFYRSGPNCRYPSAPPRLTRALGSSALVDPRDDRIL